MGSGRGDGPAVAEPGTAAAPRRPRPSVGCSVGAVRGPSRTPHPSVTSVVAGAVFVAGPSCPSPRRGPSPCPAGPNPGRSHPRYRAPVAAERSRTAPGAGGDRARLRHACGRGGGVGMRGRGGSVTSGVPERGLGPPGRHVGVVALGCSLLHQPIQHLHRQPARSVSPELCFRLDTSLA